MPRLPLYPLIPRLDKATGRIIIFMMQGRQLSYYDPMEGHGVADVGYYHKQTKPCTKEQAEKAFNQYVGDLTDFVQCTPVLRRHLFYFTPIKT